MADLEIDVRDLVPGIPYRLHKREAAASYAHYKGVAYPYFGFAKAKSTEKGLPTCLPIASSSINYLTNSLFGKPPLLHCKNKDLESWLTQVYKYEIEPRLIRIRDTGGLFGNVFVKFSIDEQLGVKIQLIDCRYFYTVADPIDKENILALVIRYPVLRKGKYYWFSEAWTNDQHIVWDLEPIDKFGFQFPNIPFFYDTVVENQFSQGISPDLKYQEEPNEYGFIPGVIIENKDSVSPIPCGDIFDLRHLLRRIDLVYHLMDVSNQKEADPILALINTVDKEDVPSAIEAGDRVEVKSDVTEDGQVLPADIKLLEADGNMRTHMERYAVDMRSMFYENLSVVFPRAEEITNKGNMTPGVFQGMYAPTTLAMNRLVVQYGIKGLQILLAKIVIASKKITGESKPGNAILNALDTFDLTFRSQLALDEQSKLYATERILREIDAGLIPVEVGIKKIAELEEVPSEEWLAEQVSAAKTAMEKRLEPKPTAGNDLPRVEKKDKDK